MKTPFLTKGTQDIIGFLSIIVNGDIFRNKWHITLYFRFAIKP